MWHADPTFMRKCICLLIVFVCDNQDQLGTRHAQNNIELQKGRGVCVCVCVSPGYGDTLCVAVLRADGFLELIQLPGLLQLLHQALHSLFTPFILLSSSVLLPYSSDARASAPR